MGAALALWLAPVAACQCPPPDDAGAFAAARAVFIVEITALRERGEVTEAAFRVLGVFKGDPGYVTALRTERGPRMHCDLPLSVGGRYLVFAGDEPVVSLSACGPGRQLEAGSAARPDRRGFGPKYGP